MANANNAVMPNGEQHVPMIAGMHHFSKSIGDSA